MTFLAPWLLSLAAFAGVPLLLHLLRRRVTQRVEFPAVRFLVEAERAHQRERVLRHRALLVLRVLAALLVAFAAARPLARFGASLVGAGHPPVALAMVLDQSASTGVVVQDTSVWQRQLRVVRDLLARLQADDRAWILTTAGLLVSGPPETLRAALDSLAPMPRADDVAGALRRAYRVLAGARAAGDGVRRAPIVVVVTDGQLGAGERERVVNATAFDSVPPTLVHVIPIVAPRNASITALDLEGAAWLPGSTLAATIVRPRSSGTRVPMAWRLESGTRTLSRGTLDTVTSTTPGAGSEMSRAARSDTVHLQWTPSTLALRDTGWIPLRLTLDADALVADNQREVLVRRAPPPNVTVREGAGLFVRTALETMADAGRVTLSPGTAQDVLVLDAAELDATPGGVVGNAALIVVAPGDPLRVAAANRALASRRIPWRYGALLRDTTALVVNGRDARASSSVVARALHGVTVAQRYQLTSTLDGEPTDATGRVVAGAGGVPWMVSGEAPGTRGAVRYLLLGSPLTPDATRVPISAAFVPWLTATVLTELTGGAPPDSATRFNLPPEESDFTQLGSLDAWSALDNVAQTRRGATFTMVRDAGTLVRETFRQAGARSLVRPLLLAALLLLVTEGWLARPMVRDAPRAVPRQ